MITLEGAEELMRLLSKWSSTTIRENRSGYLRRFRCPDCRGDASETFRKMTDDELVWWEVEWRSRCGYVWDGFSSDDVSGRFIEVADENGIVVGMVDGSNPPPWRRWEPGQGFRYAEFSTLWQAWHIGVRECRLLAAIQSGKRHGHRMRSPAS
jgi:hypothetical protein